MKYMFISQTLSQGGAERVISILATALTEQKHEVAVVKYFKTENEYSIGEKVQVLNLSNGDIAAYQRKNQFQIIKALRRAIKTFVPDVIIPFTYPVAQMTELATLGLSVNVFQSIRINPALGPAQRWRRWLRDRLVYRSKLTFVQNAQQRDYFKPQYHNRIHILSNPVSEELFMVRPKIANDEYEVCALGRLTDQKNYKLLIEAFNDAFSNMSSVFLRIYGEGAKKEDLQIYIDKLGMTSKIQLMGRTNDVKAAFKEADLYVLSSDWEGMPNTLIEAMACHVLSISTDCPTGPSDLIKNGENGFLVPMKGRKALRDAMLSAYNMPYDERIAMSEKGRKTVKEKCSSQIIASEMNSICESAIK